MNGRRPRVAVIGGGITGLVAAFELGRTQPLCEVTVFEAADVIGGKIASHSADGYTADLGPNGFLDSGSDLRRVVDALGLADELVPAADQARDRFILTGGRLLPVPSTARSVLSTPLLPATAKARLLAEPLVGRVEGPEETVHAFLARRFGRQAAQLLAPLLVHGVSAGDPRMISLDAAFPRIRELERQHRGLLALAARTRWRQLRSGTAAATRLTSFRGGMRVLVDALAARLAGAVRTRSPVDRLERCAAGGWSIWTPHGEIRADQVLLAVPAPAAARLLRQHLPCAAQRLRAVHYAPIRVTALGYRRRGLPMVPRGFGFLAAPGEHTRMFGTVYSSSVFPDTAPADGVLLRVFAGGVEHPELTRLPADLAIERFHRDLAPLLGLTEPPEFTHDHVWREGIPQYELGHQARIQSVLSELATLPGLHAAGSAYHGVAVKDCVSDARRAVAEIRSAISAAGGSTTPTTGSTTSTTGSTTPTTGSTTPTTGSTTPTTGSTTPTTGSTTSTTA
ncbi:protoporphyrinogen oxidase [Streptantibioticus ferralitis]|uniref:Coproporphyrinogen III oxidase n=1 Tax=Streptantibioticus ferralitis TaxID=236510 RepID=A0ABT5YWP5_9ACTN|nr:protoporphyrinogen oxidase [Streptantibioticus ferralitis]MDF2256031.1 protoporphyrinogen oxidase [Streptantibioticus ferralitis]